MIKALFIFSVSLSIVSNSFAQLQNEPHPIDIKLEKCHSIDSNQTTLGMKNCEWVAYGEWEKEIDKYYNLLLDTLSLETSVILIEAHNNWKIFSENEHEFSRQLYYNEMEGTMWHVINASRLKNIVKQRALELKEYYDTFTFNP